MKTYPCGLVAALLLLSTLDPQLSNCFAQNTVVTYQGHVTSNGTNFAVITFWSNDDTNVNGIVNPLAGNRFYRLFKP